MTALTIACIVFSIYFLPTAIAICRGHRNVPAIFALNLLTGWTAVGWVFAVVWSLTNQR